jgi:hypothetical protein
MQGRRVGGRRLGFRLSRPRSHDPDVSRVYGDYLHAAYAMVDGHVIVLLVTYAMDRSLCYY